MNNGAHKPLALLALFTLLVPVIKLQAVDKLTLTGTAMCAKCVLHETDKCQTVLEVKTTGSTVERYYFTSEKDHNKFCQGRTDGVTVTGTVSEKDGRKFITPETVTVK